MRALLFVLSRLSLRINYFRRVFLFTLIFLYVHDNNRKCLCTHLQLTMKAHDEKHNDLLNEWNFQFH